MSEDPEATEERGFTVIDRRGVEKTEPEDTPSAKEAGSDRATAAEPEPGAAAAASARAEGGALPQIDFSTLILSLSTSALYHLGLVEDPDTKQPGPVNKPLARQNIDTLELLQEKTQGNLHPEEVKLLESLLYELRLRFVEPR